MKKNIKIILIVSFIFLVLSILYIKNNAVLFSYVNPYTETAGFPHIKNCIKELNEALNYAKKMSSDEGYKINYIFFDSYGSGFIKNNPIPNDLDNSVGVDLGTFEYNGQNKKDIAINIANAISNFEYYLNYYMDKNENNGIYAEQSPVQILRILHLQKKEKVQNITDNLDNALKNTNYIIYTKKSYIDNTNKKNVYTIPYIMKSHSIMLTNSTPINLYSDTFSYSNNQPRYMRELCIFPKYFVKIKTPNKKITTIFLEPEVFLGTRIDLTQGFYSSSVFINPYSLFFLNNTDLIHKDYLHIRIKTFLHHLNAFNNEKNDDFFKAKTFKRLIQVADIMNPLLSPDKYQEIKNYASENLNNKDIILINEYLNISKTLDAIVNNPYYYFKMKEKNKIEEIYNQLGIVISELEKGETFEPQLMQSTKYMYKNVFIKALSLNNLDDINKYQDLLKQSKNGEIDRQISNALKTKVHNIQKLDEYYNMFEKFYNKAGYRKIEMYWLDKNTIGIKETPSTVKIKDLKQMAKENNLVDINYKLIKNPELLPPTMRYDAWVRYNTTKAEDENYKNMLAILLKDKIHFNIKWKLVF